MKTKSSLTDLTKNGNFNEGNRMRTTGIILYVTMSIVFVFMLIVPFTMSFAAVPNHNNISNPPIGSYLGQTSPGMEPQLFSPGFISTGLMERDAAFTPDMKEFYYTIVLGRFAVIMVSLQDAKGEWSAPEVAPFSGRYSDSEPCIAPGGKRFYFVSKRPLPGTEKESEFFNIWFMERNGEKWGPPKAIGAPINGKWNVFYPSLTRDGTLYFNKRINPQDGEFIYRSRLKNGKYQEPEKLGPGVNTTNAQFNAFVAPDESYLIIPIWGRKDSLGGSDYYISFRKADDTWDGPYNLGEKINTPQSEFTPYVSPDGKYFFFSRSINTITNQTPAQQLTYKEILEKSNHWENGSSDLYWVDIEAILQLKK